MTPEDYAAQEFGSCTWAERGHPCPMDGGPEARCEFCSCLYAVRAAVSAERERCARVAEGHPFATGGYIASVIRGKSK